MGKKSKSTGIHDDYSKHIQEYTQELNRVSSRHTSHLDLSYLKDFLELTHTIFTITKQYPLVPPSQELFRLITERYTILLANIISLISNNYTINYKSYNYNTIAQDQDIIALYKALLILYAQTALELEKIFYLEHKYFNVKQSGHYTHNLHKAYFNRCLSTAEQSYLSLNTIQVFNYIQAKASRYR